MKRLIFILFTLVVYSSCSKEKTISEELVGEWIYERETFNSFSTFEDPDTKGFMTFNDDETGRWNSNGNFNNYNIEWDLQSNDEKIAITKYFDSSTPITTFPFTTIYDINRTNEDKFTFTFHFKTESIIDTIEPFEQFENIILTRFD